MDLSAAHHHPNFPHQEMGSDQSDSAQSLNTMIQNPDPTQTQDQKKQRPPDDGPQKCPRCDSTNTKFCYYNNYSLTQPRYFCKACRRYWTKGGTLRNVPVGGGCRKSSKRSSASSPSLSPSHFIKRPHSGDTMPATVSLPDPVFSNLSLAAAAYSSQLMGLDFDMLGNSCLPMSTRALPYQGQNEMSLLHQLQYGSGGGLMFQNLCNYEEAGGGNSNCVSGISEDIAAAMGPYEDVLSSDGGLAPVVKEERGENGEIWGLPWQMNGDHGSLMGVGGGDVEQIRENWNGFIGNSAWGLLNTPALM